MANLPWYSYEELCLKSTLMTKVINKIPKENRTKTMWEHLFAILTLRKRLYGGLVEEEYEQCVKDMAKYLYKEEN